MFEKISQAAEQVATRASRREFFGQLGRGAMAAAAAVAGVVALPAIGEAGRKPPVICTGGDPGCIGRPVGSSCGGGRDGGTGTCQPPKHGRDSTSCDCR